MYPPHKAAKHTVECITRQGVARHFLKSLRGHRLQTNLTRKQVTGKGSRPLELR